MSATKGTPASSQIIGLESRNEALTNDLATARAEIADLKAQITRLSTVTEDGVEAGWMALKERVCADPVKAVRCVMVARADFRAALEAFTRRANDGVA